MSSLSRLVSNLSKEQTQHGLSFNEDFKVKVLNLSQSMHYNIQKATSSVTMFNDQLLKDINSAGDYFKGRNSSASCYMTQWDMHRHYSSFKTLGLFAIEAARDIPLALRTHPDGTPNPISYYIQETWGLKYNNGHACKSHTHWPSTWSYTYCVEACKSCAPLCFPQEKGLHSIPPVTGQLILFPSWVNHLVPEHICEHERVMISGNLDVDWKKNGT
jgi:hypothetical protein